MECFGADKWSDSTSVFGRFNSMQIKVEVLANVRPFYYARAQLSTLVLGGTQ